VNGLRSPHRSKQRVLLIGFDCADSELVDKWCGEGHLPTCAALRREGVWRPLRTSSEVMHVSAWPTLYTGTLPGVHGVSHAYHVRAGEQRIRFGDFHFGAPPFWKYLDDAGLKCIVMDAFASVPVKDFNGIQIQEYGTWTWFGQPCSTPSRLLSDIKRRFGPYPAPEHTNLVNVPKDLPSYRDQLVAGAEIKSRIMQALLREHDWDFAFISFGEAHAAGHYLWHASDSEFPVRPPERVEGRDLLRDVYVAVDRAIGSILDVVDDAPVIVTSVDGMGPNYSASHFMPEVLHRMDLFHSNDVGRNAGADGHTKRSLVRELREAIPLSARQAVGRCLPRRLQSWRQLAWLNSGIDWTRSGVFCIPSSDEACLRVNLAGREPRGIVEPAEYDALIQRLQRDLRGLVNPLNQRAVVEHVVPVHAVFPGPRTGDLPDVVVKWNANARVSSELSSPSFETIRTRAGHDVPPFYTGNHRNVAFAIARGPSIPENIALDGGHVVEVAPTILDLLGVEPPRHFESGPWSFRAR
jgi:predicted AlkP superfamily phosphohydrolase/phosphomutase